MALITGRPYVLSGVFVFVSKKSKCLGKRGHINQLDIQYMYLDYN